VHGPVQLSEPGDMHVQLQLLDVLCLRDRLLVRSEPTFAVLLTLAPLLRAGAFLAVLIPVPVVQPTRARERSRTSIPNF
jgi:hypothetical protein